MASRAPVAPGIVPAATEVRRRRRRAPRPAACDGSIDGLYRHYSGVIDPPAAANTQHIRVLLLNAVWFEKFTQTDIFNFLL